MLRSLLAHLVANIIGLVAANALVAGMTVQGGVLTFLICGGVLGVINTFVKPLVKFLSLPFIFLSMGLFLIIINALMLWIAEYVIGYLAVQPQLIDLMEGVVFTLGNWGDYVLAAVVLSIANFFTHWFLKIK